MCTQEFGEKNIEGERESTRKTLFRWNDNIKMDLPRSGMGVWIEFPWLRIETVGGHLSGSIKCGELLDWLRTG
jgi:hypothetical protein